MCLTGGYSRLVVVPARQATLACGPVRQPFVLVFIPQAGWRAGTTTLCHSRLYPPASVSGTKNMAFWIILDRYKGKSLIIG
jgi:hypothetical protein